MVIDDNSSNDLFRISCHIFEIGMILDPLYATNYLTTYFIIYKLQCFGYI